MITRSVYLRSALALIAILTVVSCAGTSHQRVQALSRPDSAERYFARLFDQHDPRIATDAITLSRVGSLAQLYALHQVHVLSAILDAYPVGLATRPDARTQRDGATIRTCRSDTRPACVYFSALSIEKGKLVSFRIDGHPLTGRFIDVQPAVSFGGSSFTAVSGYRGIDGATTFVVAATSGRTPVKLLAANAAFEGASRDARTAALNSLSPTNPPKPDASQACLIQFRNVDYDGTLLLPIEVGRIAGIVKVPVRWHSG